MIIFNLVLLSQKLKRSPRLFLGLITVGALVAEIIFLAPAIPEDQLVVMRVDDETHISSLRPIDDRADPPAEEGLVLRALLLALVGPETVSDEDTP